MKDTKQAAWPW